MWLISYKIKGYLITYMSWNALVMFIKDDLTFLSLTTFSLNKYKLITKISNEIKTIKNIYLLSKIFLIALALARVFLVRFA